MRDFAAIDFETANNERSSVCSVGIVIVRDEEIVDSFYSLINPELLQLLVQSGTWTDTRRHRYSSNLPRSVEADRTVD